MTTDRRTFVQRLNDATKRLSEPGVGGLSRKGLAVLVTLAAGVPDLLDERDALQAALAEAQSRVDGQAWAELEADRDRYRDALAELLAGIAASPRPDQRNWVEARVYLPGLDDAREMMRGAS